MLVLSTLNSLLAQLVTPSLHTAILSTPQGHIVAFACDQVPTSEDRLRILVGLCGEAWKEEDRVAEEGDFGRSGESLGPNVFSDKIDEEVGMLECEVSSASSCRRINRVFTSILTIRQIIS